MKYIVIASLLSVSCATSSNDTTTSIANVETADAVELCSEDTEAKTGVLCHYHYEWQKPATWWGYRYDQKIDENGQVTLSELKCQWDITCSADGIATSDAGEECAETIGTGCDPRSETTRVEKKFDWVDPKQPWNMETAKEYCDGRVALGDLTNDFFRACVAFNQTVEQYEDICCVADEAMNDAQAPSSSPSSAW